MRAAKKEGPRDRQPNMPLGGHEGGGGVPTLGLRMCTAYVARRAAPSRPDTRGATDAVAARA
jgi:hypothetical protein